MEVIKPTKVETTYRHKETGELFKERKDWEAKGYKAEDMAQDVNVVMPSLDLFGKTKQNRTMAITRAQQAKQLLANGGRIGLKGGADASQFNVERSKQKTPNVSAGGASFNKLDDAPSGDDIRRNREEFETAVGKANLERLKEEGVPKSNMPGLLGLGLNATKKLRDFTLKKNIEYFEDLNTTKYPKTLEGYTQYMQDRSAGLIDAAGNTIMTGGDDPFIPINQMSTNMDQAPEEEVLSPIQQALLDRGDASAFLATGGRVGLKGGADASQFDKSPSEQRSVDISPSGSVTLGSGPPEGPDDRGSDRQNTVQTLVNLGYTPKEIRRITEGPNVIDRIKESRFNNPVTRGILRTGLYTLNPTLGPLDFRKAMQLKGLYDTTMDSLNFPNEEDMTLGFSFNPFKKEEPVVTESEEVVYPTSGYEDPDRLKEKKDAISEAEAELRAQGVLKADGGRIDFMGGGPVGGIMDLESGRKMYFLGKLVKKATRAVKKIVKSPIGKAALFAAPFLASGGLGSLGTFLKTKAMPFLFEGGKFSGGLTGGGKLALGGALTLAPLLFQEDTNEDDYQKFASQSGPGLPAPIADIRNNYRNYMGTAFLADGGRPEPVAKKTMPLLDMDGKEMDFRAEGGFVPIGRMERADDVPARLSKNEFVFTADAVRNAGDGDIDKGAEVMYNMMKNLEAGGEVSEESQGLDGARKMFQTSQRLEEVL